MFGLWHKDLNGEPNIVLFILLEILFTYGREVNIVDWKIFYIFKDIGKQNTSILSFIYSHNISLSQTYFTYCVVQNNNVWSVNKLVSWHLMVIFLIVLLAHILIIIKMEIKEYGRKPEISKNLAQAKSVNCHDKSTNLHIFGITPQIQWNFPGAVFTERCGVKAFVLHGYQISVGIGK